MSVPPALEPPEWLMNLYALHSMRWRLRPEKIHESQYHIVCCNCTHIVAYLSYTPSYELSPDRCREQLERMVAHHVCYQPMRGIS